MKLRFLGGAREVGRSAILVDDLLLDYGVKTGNPPEYPVDSSIDRDEVVASHGHLDHVGTIPALMTTNDRPAVHQTPPTRDLTRLLAEDTIEIARGGSYRVPFSHEHISRLSQASRVHPYGGVFEASEFTCEFGNAGHIPGSATVRVEDDETALLYSGDINTVETRLLEPAPEPPESDAMIIESTYFNHSHSKRDKLEEEFAKSVRETLYQGGDVIIPVFAIGRTQEILMVLNEYDIPCYVDGMGKDVTHIARSYPEYIKDADELKRAWNHAKKVDPSRRGRVLGNDAAIVTTSGMLSGGPAMYYMKQIYDDPTNKVCLTGYQVEDTPGRNALESGRAEIDGDLLRISAQVELHDFSAHSDGKRLKEYVKSAADKGVEKVFCVHGDGEDCVDFAEWIEESIGIKAVAPEVGESYSV